MPKVPTQTESLVQLKPTPIPQGAMGNLGKEVVDLSEGISSLADQFQKVQDLNDKTKAIVALSSANDVTHNKYMTDPDLYNAYDNSAKDLDKNTEAAANLIHSPEARNQFLEEASRMKDSKQTAINNMIQGRILQQSKASVNQRTQAAQQSYNHSNSPEQEEYIKKNYNNYLDELESTGSVNVEWAETHRAIQNYQFGNQKLLNDIAIARDPKMIQTIKDKADKGDYGNLRDIDYDNAMRKADSQSLILDNKLKKNMRNLQERNARDLDYMFRTGNPNLEQHAEEKYYTGQIDKKTFDNYTGGNKKASLINPTTDGAAYTEALAYIADPKTSIADARNFIMKKYNDNQISPEDRNKLYDLAIRPMGDQYKSIKDVIGLEQTKKDETDTFKRHLNASLDFIHNSMPFGKHLPDSLFGNQGKYKADDKSFQMAKRFIQKISNNVPPEDFISTANDVINEQRLLDRPEISAYRDEGQTEQDENGNRAVTTPDGNTQPEESAVDSLDANY